MRATLMATVMVALLLAPAAPASAADVMCGGKTATIVGERGVHYEKIVGTDGDDVIHGRGGWDAIYGKEGNDTICGGHGGQNYLYGNGGRDTLIGGDPDRCCSHTWLRGGTGADLIDMRLEGMRAWGGPGDDRILNGRFADFIAPGRGRDAVVGVSGERDDVIVEFGDEPRSITVDLAAGYAKTADGTETLSNIWRVSGTGFDDVLYGSAGADSLFGGGGRNEIYGREGDDQLEGFGNLFGQGGNDAILGYGESVVRGGEGNDWVHGAGYLGRDGDYSQRQEIYGGPGDDNLSGHIGDDHLDGGDGRDSAFFRPWTYTYGDGSLGLGYEWAWPSEGFTIDLAAGTAVSHAEEPERDTLVNLENIEGSKYNDLIIGNSRANRLKGLTGDDELRGRGGDDLLDGHGYLAPHEGVDDDAAFGGEGNDTCYAEATTNCEGPQ